MQQNPAWQSVLAEMQPRFLGMAARSAGTARAGTKRRGFTLVELLAVIAIIGLLSALVVPAVGKIMGAFQLTQSVETVSSQLTLARQRAVAKNRMVEVRFYRFGDPEAGEDKTNPASGNYHALQVFEYAPVPSGTSTQPTSVAYDKVKRLPGAIIIDSGAQLSSVLNQPSPRDPKPGTALNPKQPIPGVGDSYQFAYFRFRPDGSTDLPMSSSSGGQWFLTLREAKRGDAMATPPPNFATIQIDPVNGKVRTFRP